ncbi:DUF2309 domain-containing protein [Alicyclobacillus sp. ALC3]|uniref:DUF2309 domain-containing protein n=1 Tax=Alicyclobacillus sp. ALC3 TaxID=2796143 RepID=UPI0023796A3B|nr:DUF2309 domain-containing protein [Alicyclobacillus sp. ALC3]WDL98624.1 DUF2309 domain-containing protein [Alicyclobacillus sp. ALC3]
MTSSNTQIRHSQPEPKHLPRWDLEQALREAERAVAPLWPITAFAARSPWYGLENQTFEAVAGELRRDHGIDLYPSAEVLQRAFMAGEIDPALLERRLAGWLDHVETSLPRAVTEVYCTGALKLSPLPVTRLSHPEVERTARGLRRLALDDHTQTVARSTHLEQLGRGSYGRDLNYHVTKWCKLYLDEGQSGWSMPHRERGFYRAWRQLVTVDPALPRSVRRLLQDWPEDAERALSQALHLLDVAPTDTVTYLRDSLLRLPGWAGMMRWRAENDSSDTNLLFDYMAVRLSLEWALVAPQLPLPRGKTSGPDLLGSMDLVDCLVAWEVWGGTPIEAWDGMPRREQVARLQFARRFDDFTARRLCLNAWEDTYSARLHDTLCNSERPALDVSGERGPVSAASVSAASVSAASVSTASEAQFLFCIDVRSEPVRRRLEQSGPFETFGVAGFFGLPIALQDAAGGHMHPALPAIAKPRHIVRRSVDLRDVPNRVGPLAALEPLRQAFKRVKGDSFASLALPEVSGVWLGLSALARSVLPSSTGSLMNQVRNLMAGGAPKGWEVKPQSGAQAQTTDKPGTGLTVGIALAEQVEYVHATLRSIGLTDHFAPLVVICGHGSQSANNPYASALDCGACGGASGAANAKVFSAICNDPDVRAGLAKRGVSIPETTVFAAMEHITTTDELRFLDDKPSLSPVARAAFDTVQRAVPAVSEDVTAERLEYLPSADLGRHGQDQRTARHAYDWSETRPEWGLARNAAFVIGRRDLTKGLDLQGRVFLHSYDWQQDEDGQILAGILAGPGVVAQWINLQYYASTVAASAYGSGDKTTQTVTSGIGVMQGNGSDLLTGLPVQSVMSTDGVVYHAPLRLLIVAQAPIDHMRQVLDNLPDFRQKISFGWLRFAVLDPETGWHTLGAENV